MPYADFYIRWRALLDPQGIEEKIALAAVDGAAAEFATLSDEQMAELCPPTYLFDIEVYIDEKGVRTEIDSFSLQLWKRITALTPASRVKRVQQRADLLQDAANERKGRLAWQQFRERIW